MPWKTFDDIKMKQNLSSTEQKLWWASNSLTSLCSEQLSTA
jgi:hypothetical protein